MYIYICSEVKSNLENTASSFCQSSPFFFLCKNVPWVFFILI